MATTALTLVVNPGSASRKYAVFSGEYEWARIHFEFVDGRIVGTIEHAGEQQSTGYDDTDFSAVSRYILPLLHQYSVISDTDTVATIGIRVVAPGQRFMQDELVTSQTETALEAVQQKAPLHITTVLSELKQLETYFPGVPIVAISDSAFHLSKPPWASYYGIDIELAEKFDIKRYGYQGISVGSVVRSLDSHDQLLPKTIVCHLGSGSSITAVGHGKSVDTTMGYSPLEGLVMASRSGTIDVSAALAIKRESQLTDDGLEQYLNKQSGLSGVSGSSNDIRQLLVSEEEGDAKAHLALKIFVYRAQQAIGQMAASLGGADCLVFTATIGERSNIIRDRILDGLGYLGFTHDTVVNDRTFEAAEIARRAEQYMQSDTA